jgi:hypothetical protein
MPEPTRRKPPISPSDAMRLLAALAAADPTVSGVTLILPDGSMRYLDAADALAMTGNGPARGCA